MPKMRCVLFLLGLAALSACGQPVAVPAVSTAAPRYDGGLTFGGGGLEDPGDSTSTLGTTSTQCTTEAERGGLTFGGGGYTAPPPCTP